MILVCSSAEESDFVDQVPALSSLLHSISKLLKGVSSELGPELPKEEQAKRELTKPDSGSVVGALSETVQSDDGCALWNRRTPLLPRAIDITYFCPLKTLKKAGDFRTTAQFPVVTQKSAPLKILEPDRRRSFKRGIQLNQHKASVWTVPCSETDCQLPGCCPVFWTETCIFYALSMPSLLLTSFDYTASLPAGQVLAQHDSTGINLYVNQ